MSATIHTPSKNVIEKAAAIIASGNYEEVASQTFRIESNTQLGRSYIVTVVKLRGAVEATCNCEAGHSDTLCSHAIAAIKLSK